MTAACIIRGCTASTGLLVTGGRGGGGGKAHMHGVWILVAKYKRLPMGVHLDKYVCNGMVVGA